MDHVVFARIQPYGPRNAKKDTVAASSGVAMGCAGCAMHKGPAVRAAYSGISFFCFPIQNVVKSTEIYGFLHVFSQQLC